MEACSVQRDGTVNDDFPGGKMMRTRIACTVMVWLASTSIGLAEWSENQDLSYMVGDAQFFAPRDLSTFDEKPYANEGLYFTAHLLNYQVTSPQRVTIGNVDAVGQPAFFGPEGLVWENLMEFRAQDNSIDTSGFRDDRQTGQEYSVGYMEDDAGWSVRGFEMHGTRQQIRTTDAMVAFSDPAGLLSLDYNLSRAILPPPTEPPFRRFVGQFTFPLGVMFEEMNADLRTRFYSVEANYVLRHRGHFGGYCEWSFGPRLFMFEESFGVRGYGGILDDSMWYTDAHNYCVGPQIGYRWFKRSGSWQYNIEARGTAALNWHETRQQTHLASAGSTQPFLLIEPFFPELTVFPFDQSLGVLESRSNDRYRSMRFSPIGELKFSASYILTRKCSVSVGYDLLCVGGLSRPTNMVRYEFPRMGIERDARPDMMFAHGLNLAIEFNH